MVASLLPEHNYDGINDRYQWDESIGINFFYCLQKWRSYKYLKLQLIVLK